MEKGIIVVDVPKLCCECPFFDVLEESNIMYCSVSELGHCEHLPKFIENEYLKPDWCPIKPCYSSGDQNASLIDDESVVLSPKELIRLLKKAPQDDILMVEINDGNGESGVADDVMIGGGTGKGFTYIKVSTDI